MNNYMFRLSCMAIICSMLGFAFWAAQSVFVFHDHSIYSEAGLLETLQVLLLGVSCVAFLVPVLRSRETDKLILSSCALLCCTFVLREIDVERLDVHPALQLIGSGTGRDMLLGAGFTALFSCAASKASYYWRRSLLFVRSPSGVLLMAGGLFLGVGHLFELWDRLPAHVFIEELAEFCGYCFILMSSIAANSGIPAATAEGMERLAPPRTTRRHVHGSGTQKA